MRKLFVTAVLLFGLTCVYSQENRISLEVKEINRNLKVLSTTTPDKPGGLTFDNSYEGVKGGTYLFEKFVPLFVRVKESEFYVPVEANLDLKANSFHYLDAGKVMSVPSDRIYEIILKNETGYHIYKTSENRTFKPKLEGIQFIQVLAEEPVELVKVPMKVFIPADYQGAYTADRRYDEYRTEYRYYSPGENNIYRQVKPNEHWLLKSFPDRKQVVKELYKNRAIEDDEKMAIYVLDKLKQ